MANWYLQMTDRNVKVLFFSHAKDAKIRRLTPATPQRSD
jgi:hypothetical protein